MAAVLLDGNVLLDTVKKDLAARIKTLGDRGVTPGLGTILVGDDPSSAAYVRGKHENAAELGIASFPVELPATASQTDVTDAIAAFNRNPEVEGFIVQEMAEPGVEMLVGAAVDPVFGPVIAVGAGGVTVELTRDVAVRIAPLTDIDADEMVRSLATFPLLDGFRGAPPRDVDALIDVVLRIAALVSDLDVITELDCNPVIVGTRGAVVVDARIAVRTPTPAPPFTATVES